MVKKTLGLVAETASRPLSLADPNQVHGPEPIQLVRRTKSFVSVLQSRTREEGPLHTFWGSLYRLHEHILSDISMMLFRGKTRNETLRWGLHDVPDWFMALQACKLQAYALNVP
jgi:hypothetical protein